MTSILPAQSIKFPRIKSQLDNPPIPQVNDPSLQRRPEMDPQDKNRGRRKSRISKDKEGAVEETSPVEDEVEVVDGHSSGTDGPTRKRRRSRKGLDKKFECPQEGCGKSYSRAEHLYRHQLNHTPKQIYNCDFPDCNRTFVRQDLCNRHRDRHTAKGSQLHRKDSMLGHNSLVTDTKPPMLHGSHSPEVIRSNLVKSRTNQLQYQSPVEMHASSYSPTTNPSSGTYSGSSTNGGDNFTFKRSNSDHIPRNHESSHNTPDMRTQRHSSFGVSDAKPVEFVRPGGPPLQTHVGPYGVLSSGSGNHSYHNNQPSPQSYVSQQNFPPFSLPPPSFNSAASTAPKHESEPAYATPMSTDYSSEGIQHQQSGSS